MQRQIAHLGAEDEALGAEEVAAIERLKQREALAQLFFCEVELEASGAVGDVGERAAQRHHAPRDAPHVALGVLLGA